MKHQEGAGTGQLVRHVLMDCLRAADPRWHGQAFGKALHILAWRQMDCARSSLVLRPFSLAAPDTLTAHSQRWLTFGSDPVPICSPQYSMGASCRRPDMTSVTLTRLCTPGFVEKPMTVVLRTGVMPVTSLLVAQHRRDQDVERQAGGAWQSEGVQIMDESPRGNACASC